MIANVILRRPAAVASPPPDPEATLWVDSATGDDARSKATVAGSGGSLPWATILRAVRGSTSWSSPNASEAAAAGDVVSIQGSGSLGSPTLYTNSTSIGSNSIPLYLPVNSGSAGNYITFRANGYVKLGAPAANSPVVGINGDSDYVKWYADRADSRFIIVCDARGGGTDDTKGDSSVVNPRPDTGPILVSGRCWIEGFDVDGGPMIDYGDNYSAIALRNGQGYTIRNNWLHDFRKDENSDTIEDTSHNQTGITAYGAQNGLIEHNLITDCGSGIIWKDTLSYQETLGNTFRRNWISGANIAASAVAKGVNWSLVTVLAHDTNFIYQNVIVDCDFAFSFTAGCPGDLITNNTVARCTIGLEGPATSTGVLVHGNIFSDVGTIIYQEGANTPASTSVDFQHNDYFNFTATFMEDLSGTHTFAAWKAEYTDQDIDDIDSITSDPLFTNAGADDFTLQSGSPARGLGIDLNDIDGDTNTTEANDAGAYQFGIALTVGLES